MATSLRGTDVVLVGVGAAGGLAALPLARAGLEVIGLEAGGWLGQRDFAPDELRNLTRAWPHSVQKANLEVPTVRPSAAAATQRQIFHPMMNAVGGTSLHFWGQAWRLNPWDFRVRSEVIKRYGASAIPTGSTVQDWPLTYDELEPYYDKVEHEIGVSGKAGNLRGTVDRRGNIFEGARNREYPMPPLRRSGLTELMSEAAKRLGWNPFPGPAAINSVPHDGRSPCAYHGHCNRGGCHVQAKGSTLVTTIPKAQATGRFKIVTNAHVTQIVVDDHGKVTGVLYHRDDQVYFQPAKVVLIGCYTYENVRLLLLSKSRAFPNGLSNNHGQVGRHFFGHIMGSEVSALFPFDLNAWYGTPAQCVSVDDWADDNFDHAGLPFIGGGNISVGMELTPMRAAGMPTFGLAPAWGSEWKKFVKLNANRWTPAFLQRTTLPYEDHFIDLDPTTKDPLGFPVARVTYGLKENEKQCALFTQEKVEKWFLEAGAIKVHKAPPQARGITPHAFGGTRMGDDAETNVVNRWGFSHEVSNLGILGASVMSTSGAHNPTLTVQALAWRTADHLIKSWKSVSEHG